MRRAGAVLSAVVLLLGAGGAAAGATAAPAPSSVAAVDLAGTGWIWPLHAFRLTNPYRAPTHAYGPGHRGIDLLPLGGTDVRAPQRGVVAFSGRVADRPIVTIDHGDGLVTTLEPVASDLVAGAAIARGAVVGTVSAGGHAAPGTVHFGVRLHGDYINPMLLLGGVPRAVLLPCCA
ncbi:hypothetical protein GCM10022240_25660 [Microbacterium kribbense]|uniref:M23ase beta-sheet core domain-containing protein n=2 Tax=Microbacterium kribbense TaxID=433645 RepID=A0ABP7GR31_9MICO